MPSGLHGFITGQLWLKLKADVAEMRVFNSTDLILAAYFHIRRHLLIQPGWSCRADVPTPVGSADLTLYQGNRFHCVLLCECLLKSGVDNFFPADMLDDKMEKLRQMLRYLDKAGSGHGYLFGTFDTAESWFFPTGGGYDAATMVPGVPQTMWERQSCFWVPVNCHEFPNYADWRAKWEKLAEQ